MCTKYLLVMTSGASSLASLLTWEDLCICMNREPLNQLRTFDDLLFHSLCFHHVAEKTTRLPIYPMVNAPQCSRPNILQQHSYHKNYLLHGLQLESLL